MKATPLTALVVFAMLAGGAAFAQSQDSRTVDEFPDAVYTYRDEVIPVQKVVVRTDPAIINTNDGAEINTGNVIRYDGIDEPAVIPGEGFTSVTSSSHTEIVHH